MRKTRAPGWLMPVYGVDFWPGLLRVIVGGAGGAALVESLGWWGLLAVPLLVPLVWLIEATALGVSHLVRHIATKRR